MKCLGTWTIPALVVMVVVAACDAASTSPSSAPATATPAAISPLATLAPPAHPSATATPASARTDAPTSAALVLGGTWVRPKSGARLTSSTTTLSARPTATGPVVTTFTKVVFSATWAGATKKVMCRATAPDTGGAWTCKADLLALGVPPGRVTFSFDVYGVGLPIARSPAGPRPVTYAVPPPAPTNTHWENIGTRQASNWETISTYRLRWSAPAGYADEFLVYQTWECPRESKANDGTPCFVAGTPVSVSKLELLARVPGDTGSVKVRLTGAECGPSYGTILLRARSAYGRSDFTIVEAMDVYWPDPDVAVC